MGHSPGEKSRYRYSMECDVTSMGTPNSHEDQTNFPSSMSKQMSTPPLLAAIDFILRFWDFPFFFPPLLLLCNTRLCRRVVGGEGDAYIPMSSVAAAFSHRRPSIHSTGRLAFNPPLHPLMLPVQKERERNRGGIVKFFWMWRWRGLSIGMERQRLYINTIPPPLDTFFDVLYWSMLGLWFVRVEREMLGYLQVVDAMGHFPTGFLTTSPTPRSVTTWIFSPSPCLAFSLPIVWLGDVGNDHRTTCFNAERTYRIWKNVSTNFESITKLWQSWNFC